MVIARSDVGGQGPEGVEGRLVADRELAVNVLLDQVHRDVARPLDHDLDVVLPGDLGQLTKRLELRELGLVVGIGDRAGAEAVTQ